MRQTNQACGACGERAAREYLISAGFSILAMNWRCPLGELDIIARERGTLVIVEVKTRSHEAWGPAEEAITRAKQRRLIRAGLWYAQAHGYSDAAVRFDVVIVRGQALEHYRDAFVVPDALCI